ncbi:TonB-dependent receptor domain-containing protein [Gluconobacter cerinus]|uniref:TonB-dependent receptor domain-containing protein n=1 Tax=Gluconobacter cerinus TaxID=38307 RepID=UPI001B8CDFB3|nr:TonB-dependent receptor [Gluconobacter cerinus]
MQKNTMQVRRWSRIGTLLIIAGLTGRHARAETFRVYHFALPSAPLAETLIRISEQSHSHIGFSPALVAGLKAGPIRGLLTSAQAVDAALAGTNLSLKIQFDRSLTIGREIATTKSNFSTRPELPTFQPSGATSKAENVEHIEAHGMRSTRIHLQNKPVASTTVDKQQIELNQITNLQEAVRLQPSVQFQSANLRNTTINIRGLGAASTGTDGLENGAAVYIDGIYQARPGTALFDIPELESVTVLKGPQGTLGGIDTTSGAIQIETRLPSFRRRAELEAQAGNYGQYIIKADYSQALENSGKAAFSLDYFQSALGGYVKNIYTNNTIYGYLDRGVRGQLLLRPDDEGNLQIRIVGGYNHNSNSMGVGLYNGTVTRYGNGNPIASTYIQAAQRVGYNIPTANPYGLGTDINSQQMIRSEDANLSMHADYNLHGYTLSSITAGSIWNFYPKLDSDATGIDIYAANQAQNYQRQFTQEFRITSPSHRLFEYSGGLFYMWQEVKDHSRRTYGSQYAAYSASASATPEAIALTDRALNGLSVLSNEKPTTNAYSAYANATWHALPRLDIIGGFRYTYETKNGSFLQYLDGGGNVAGLTGAQKTLVLKQRSAQLAADPYQALKHDNGLVSGQMTVSYHVTPTQLVYGTYSRGEKSGGVLLIGLASNVPATVKSEYLDNYEIGYKSTFLNGKITFNADAFWMVDHNYQTSIVQYNSAGLALTYLSNAKSAITRGFEADLRYNPTSNLSMFASATYDDAYYNSFASAPCAIENSYNKSCNFTGSRLALVPKWVGVLGFDYQHPVGHVGGVNLMAYGGATYTMQSSFFSATNDSIYSRINGYALLNLTFGLRSEDRKWDVSGWIHNATDKKYFTLLAGSSPLMAQVGMPLAFGGSVRLRL